MLTNVLTIGTFNSKNPTSTLNSSTDGKRRKSIPRVRTLLDKSVPAGQKEAVNGAEPKKKSKKAQPAKSGSRGSGKRPSSPATTSQSSRASNRAASSSSSSTDFPVPDLKSTATKSFEESFTKSVNQSLRSYHKSVKDAYKAKLHSKIRAQGDLEQQCKKLQDTLNKKLSENQKLKAELKESNQKLHELQNAVGTARNFIKSALRSSKVIQKSDGCESEAKESPEESESSAASDSSSQLYSVSSHNLHTGPCRGHSGLMKFIATSVLFTSVVAVLSKAKFGDELRQLQHELVSNNAGVAAISQQLEGCPEGQLTECALGLLSQYGEVDPAIRFNLETLGNSATSVRSELQSCSATGNQEACKNSATTKALPELVKNAKQVLMTVKMAYPGAFEIPEMRKLEAILAKYEADNESTDFQDELKESLQTLETRFRSFSIA
ncbi:hypothetical protein PSACC_01807 [Paramicrosporidium saccamoebae]|uniref:Uncharacterized protein n=1 Tax=Paramicrosporidium saccamoebae TaxID=1246581 RepID=A0A2H9TKY9_9FUNG|nr:hypothetical protein PSACC_01807 [Paramicrosporidium saccamoebae]